MKKWTISILGCSYFGNHFFLSFFLVLLSFLWKSEENSAVTHYAHRNNMNNEFILCVSYVPIAATTYVSLCLGVNIYLE